VGSHRISERGFANKKKKTYTEVGRERVTDLEQVLKHVSTIKTGIRVYLFKN